MLTFRFGLTKKEGNMKKTVFLGFIVFLVATWFGIAFADHHAIKIAEKEGIGKHLYRCQGHDALLVQKRCSG